MIDFNWDWLAAPRQWFGDYGGYVIGASGWGLYLFSEIMDRINAHRGYAMDVVKILEMRAKSVSGGRTKVVFKARGSLKLSDLFKSGKIISREVRNNATSNANAIQRKKRRNPEEPTQPFFTLPSSREWQILEQLEDGLEDRNIELKREGTHIAALHCTWDCGTKQIRLLIVPLSLLDLLSGEDPESKKFVFPRKADHKILFRDLPALQRKYQADRMLPVEKQQILTIEN